MRALFFTLGIIFLSINSLPAQCIFILGSSQNCMRCELMVRSFFNPAKTNLPTFLVFSNQYASDSLDIVRQFKPLIDLGLVPIYNDHILEMFPESRNIFLTDCDGNISDKFNFLDLDTAAVSQALTKAVSKPEVKLSPFTEFLYVSDSIIAYDSKLGLLKVSQQISTDSMHTWSFTLDSIRFSKVKRALNMKLKGSMTFLDDYLTKKPHMSNFFKPKINRYVLTNNFILLPVTVPYLIVGNNPEKMVLASETVILKILNQDSFDVCFIEIVDSTLRQSHYIMPNNFMAINEDELLLLFPNKNYATDTAKLFIGKFKLKNKQYEFEDFLPLKIPDEYLGNIPYPDPFTYTSFSLGAFPYYITSLGTELYNLKENTILRDFKFKNFERPRSMDFNLSPIVNYKLYRDSIRDCVYVFSKINDKLGFQIWNTDSRIMERVLFLKDIGLSFSNKYPFIQVWSEKNVILCPNKKGIVRYFPINLLKVE